MPAAFTLILICPSAGSGRGTRAHFSTSGGPYPVITTAFGMAVSFLVAATQVAANVGEHPTGITSENTRANDPGAADKHREHVRSPPELGYARYRAGRRHIPHPKLRDTSRTCNKVIRHVMVRQPGN
jgi:hypothetical protein